MAINADGVIDRVVWEGSTSNIAVQLSGALLVMSEGLVVAVESGGRQTILAGRVRFGEEEERPPKLS